MVGTVAAATYGTVVAVGLLAWARLARTVGPATAIAGLSIVTAGLTAAAAPAIVGSCDGCLATVTVGELLIAGALLPWTVAAAVAPPVWAGKAVAALWRRRRGRR